MKRKLQITGPGLLLCIIIASLAWHLGRLLPVIGGPVFGILSTLSASFLTAFLAGKALKLQGKKAILIGVGTSICGGSAIAATAPVIRARDEDVAHAISTIFLFNIIAVFIFPALGHAFGMSDFGFGMWAGTAINDTSSVVAAGVAWSAAAGNNNALAYATVVKLTRTMMIIPITLILAIYTGIKSKNAAGGSGFRFSKVFPWFIIGFVATAVINTFAGIPVQISHWLVTIGKFLIVTAMVGIGLNTNLKKLITSGFKPILLGLCCWFAVAGAALLVQYATRIW